MAGLFAVWALRAGRERFDPFGERSDNEDEEEDNLDDVEEPEDDGRVVTAPAMKTKAKWEVNAAEVADAAFDLTDKALAAIAGANSRLQEAITTGEVTSKRSTENGQDYVTFSVSRATTPGEYAVKITVDNTGRLFAYVLTAPERTFEQERKTFARMLDSFRTYDSVSQFV